MRYPKLRSILRLFPMALPWHRNISVAAVLLLLVGGVVACGPGHSSHLVDLGTGEHTNIGSSLGGTVVPASDLVAIHVLPNTNVPKGVVVSLYDSLAGSNAAHIPGVTNSLVLRDHMIVPDPGIQALRDLTSERFGRQLGGATSQVHFIDDRQYHKKWGEVHCGTNVIREMDLPFRAATR